MVVDLDNTHGLYYAKPYHIIPYHTILYQIPHWEDASANTAMCADPHRARASPAEQRVHVTR